MLERVEEAVATVARPDAPAVAVKEAPLLLGPEAEEVIARAARLLAPVARALAAAPVPAKLAGECRALVFDDPEQAVRAAIQGAATGVAGFVAWKAISRALPPIDSSQWNRSTCPACGALPAMAELHEGKRGRERALVCGRCATHWGYKRIGCPYCGNDEVEKLSCLDPEEPGFRIDVCRACNGYLKTYLGDGGNPHALSDWSTLHLDVVCSERGLSRPSPSLYLL